MFFRAHFLLGATVNMQYVVWSDNLEITEETILYFCYLWDLRKQGRHVPISFTNTI